MSDEIEDEKQALQQQIRSAQNTLRYIEALDKANDAYTANPTEAEWEKVEQALLLLQVAKWKQRLETGEASPHVSEQTIQDTIAMCKVYLDAPENIEFDAVQTAWNQVDLSFPHRAFAKSCSAAY